MKDKILDIVKSRIEYLEKVGGCSEANIKSTKDAISEIGYIADEILSFDCCKDENGELRRLMIEAASSIIFMISLLDNKMSWGDTGSLIKKMINDMPAPGFKNGGIVFNPGNFPGGMNLNTP